MPSDEPSASVEKNGLLCPPTNALLRFKAFLVIDAEVAGRIKHGLGTSASLAPRPKKGATSHRGTGISRMRFSAFARATKVFFRGWIIEKMRGTGKLFQTVCTVGPHQKRPQKFHRCMTSPVVKSVFQLHLAVPLWSPLNCLEARFLLTAAVVDPHANAHGPFQRRRNW